MRPDTTDSLDYRETVLTIPVRAYPGYAQVAEVVAPEGMEARQAVFDKYKPQLDEIEKKYNRAVYERPYSETEEAAQERADLANSREEIEAIRNLEANEAYRVPIPAYLDFRGPHFKEQNIVAHVRTTKRTGPGYGRVLFVEEIQSDWAQQARDRGFAHVYGRDDIVAEELGFLDDTGATGYRFTLSEAGARYGKKSEPGMVLKIVYAKSLDGAFAEMLAELDSRLSTPAS